MSDPTSPIPVTPASADSLPVEETSPSVPTDEDEQFRRIKSERLRHIEHGRNEQLAEEEKLRQVRAEQFNPYALPSARAQTTRLNAEARLAQQQAEREAGVDDVALGPPPAANTTRRNRVPVALLALIPVLAILVVPILMGNASNIRAEPGKGAMGSDGKLYLAAESKNNQLVGTMEWNAPPINFVRVSGADKKGNDRAEIVWNEVNDAAGQMPQVRRVTLSPILGNSQTLEVVPVPSRPGMAMLVGGAVPGGVEGEYVLYVGPRGARLVLTNDTEAENAAPLSIYILSRPNPRNFLVGNQTSGEAVPIAGTAQSKPPVTLLALPGEPVILPVARVDNGTDEDTLVLLSGDNKRPLVTVRLRRSPKDNGEQAIDTLLAGKLDEALAAAPATINDPSALAVRAYVLKSRQLQAVPNAANAIEAGKADHALKAALQAVAQTPGASDRAKGLVRRAMALEATRQKRPDQAAKFKAESEAFSPDLTSLP
jgi:hypothetical protein